MKGYLGASPLSGVSSRADTMTCMYMFAHMYDIVGMLAHVCDIHVYVITHMCHSYMFAHMCDICVYVCAHV